MENSIQIPAISKQRNMWASDIAKRSFDIIVSLLVLFFFAPLYGFIAIAIKRDTPGPVFFRGTRMGRHGKYFKILKFRTMYETPQSYAGPKVTAQDDDRITPIGHWLRNTKLNEFPQFWNVLKGDMSLVGPRPEDPTLAKTWPVSVAQEINSVRPGITSPASVLYRNEENMLQAKDVLRKYLHELTPDKMRLDQLYVHYRSFWLDLDTILWTALLLIPKIRTYSPPEKILFLGPVTRLTQRYLFWFLQDFLIAFVSVGVSGILIRLFGPVNMGWLQSFQMAMSYSVLCGIFGVIFGVYRVNWTKATVWSTARVLFGWLFATVLTLFFHHFLGFNSIINSSLVVTASALSLSGFVLVRFRSRFVFGMLNRLVHSRLNSDLVRERVLIIGSGRTAEHIAWLMKHPSYSNKFQVLGFVDDDLFSQGLNIYGIKVIGSYRDVPKLVEKFDIGILLLADSQITIEEYKILTNLFNNSGPKFVIVPDVFGALKNLIVVPPFQAESVDSAKGYDPPCNYCMCKHSRLEMECQLDDWNKNGND